MRSLVLFILMFVATVSFAQNSKKDTVTIQTSAVCNECKMRIEKELAYTKGVKKSELNLEDGKVLIVYNPKKITVKEIRETIAKVGYQADDMEGDDEAYEKLPKCCKYKDVTKH